MGIAQTRQLKPQLFEETLKQFDIIDKQGSCIVFQNKTTMQKIEFWSFKYHDQDAFRKSEKDFALLKSQRCQSLMNIISTNSITHEEFCSTFYEIQILTEHPVQNFEDYLSNRGKQDYTSKELYHLIDCVTHAQLNLSNKQYLSFHNIWQADNDVWKLRSFENNYIPIDVWNKQSIHCYPAPEEFMNGVSGEKATVFTFGMLLLHVALAKSCDQLYQNNSIDGQKLQARLSELSKYFPSPVSNLISDMLILDPLQRPSYFEIQIKLKELSQCRIADSSNLMVKAIPTSNSKQVNIKSPEETSRVLNLPLLPVQEQVIINSQSIGNQYYGVGNQSIKHVPNIPVQSRVTNNKLTFADGRYYEGETNNDIMDGKGILYYKDGSIEYDGMFMNGQFHDIGTHYNSNPDAMSSNISVRDFPGIGNYWVKYEGEFQNNKKHGIGSMTFQNGDTYIGEFQRDQMNGRGTYSQKYGQTHFGFWEDSKLKY